MDARGETPFERAVALAYTTRVGLGGSAFHVGGDEGPAETVYLGVFRRDALERVGLFDETIKRGQDWELNRRLRDDRRHGVVHARARGHLPSRARAFDRLARQMFSTGLWRGELARRFPAANGIRYFIPPAMVVGVLLGLLAGIGGIIQAIAGATPWLLARIRDPGRLPALRARRDIRRRARSRRQHRRSVSRSVAVHPRLVGRRVRARLPLADEQHRQAHGKVTRMSQAEPVTTRPSSIAELRAVTQPPEVRGRRNAEHWTASLYLRNLSPYLTWMLLKTRISANGVTGLMILVGWSTAAALLIPGIWGALLAVVLGQLQMLVDCCDGEVARWRRTSSPAGVFLDKVGHYSTEALIPLALGIRAAAYPLEFPADFLWTTLGGAAGARHRAQQGAQRHGARRPRQRRPAEARRHARRDRAPRRRSSRRSARRRGSCRSTGCTTRSSSRSSRSPPPSSDCSPASRFVDRVVVAVLLPLAVLAVFGHFVAIMASRRVRA